MRTHKFLLLTFLLLTTTLFSQSLLWPEKVDALVEYEHQTFKVTGANSGVWQVKGLVQIFNPNGKKYGVLSVLENSMQTNKKFEGRVLDMNNKKIRKLKKDDIEIHSITDNITIYNDSHYKFAELSNGNFPYKIEYYYEMELSSLIYWPDWRPEEHIPVINTSYTLILDHPVEYKFWSKDGSEPAESVVDGKKNLVWSYQMLPPKADRIAFLPPEEETQKELRFAPRFFRTGKVSGSYDSWDSIAEWFRRLLVGRDHLPILARKEIEALISPEDSKRQIVEKVYSFLQNDTRYVAIHLGIGGWQPHSVESVYRNKYGDCKDLSLYTIALLKNFDIPAYPALIRTRDIGITNPEFPVSDFNHAIAFVPLEEDTLWLECTTDLLAAGQLHEDIEGCNVLVIKDDSGEIIRTPETKPDDNLWLTNTVGTLTTNGSLEFTGQMELTNNQARGYRATLAVLDNSERKEYVRSIIGNQLPKVDLSTFEMENVENNYAQPLILNFSGSASNAANSNGSRLFFNPNLLNRYKKRSALKSKEREFPIHMSYAYRDIDSVTVKIPLGYTLEGAPKSVDLETPYTRYKTTYTLTDQTLSYKRILEFKKRQIPVDAYKEHRKFMKQVRRSDNSQFVFKKG